MLRCQTMRRVAIVAVIALLFAGHPAFAQDEPSEQAATGAEARAVGAAPQKDHGWKQDVFVALIGGGARFRRIRLEVGAEAGDTENRDLETGPYFNFGWHLLIRPMGRRSPKPSIRALVLQLDGAAGVGLTVEPVGTGIALDTNTWQMWGQLGYLYPIGRSQVGGLVGVGGDVLKIDLNSVLPSSRIMYVRVGPAASHDLIPRYLTVRADFGLRFPFDLGALESAFGYDSKAFGLDSVVTFQGRLEAGFTYAFRFIWEYFAYRFAGSTDDVPAMADGGSGHDHAVYFQVLLGWSL